MANNVAAGAQTQLSAPAGKIPIIVVPGIMGSRLEDSSGARVWNPLGRPVDLPIYQPFKILDPGLSAANAQRLSDLQPLLPGTFTQEDASAMPWHVLERNAPIRNIYSCITDFYAPLCWALHEQLPDRLKAAGSTLVPTVYVAGYDWRQSNADSANTHLAPIVARALKETGAAQVVLVAHSMGGLVSRYYARQNPSKVGAYIALASPHIGAPQPYTRLKQGVVWEDNYDDYITWGLTKAMGLSQVETAELLRLFPAMYELSANRHFFAAASESWLTFVAEHAGFPYLHDAAGQGPAPVGVEIYYDLFAGLTERAATRDKAIALLDAAAQFHEELTADGKPFLPPNSFAVYTSDLPTQRKVHVPAYGHLEQKSGANEYVGSGETAFIGTGEPFLEVVVEGGDGSVPVASAFPQNTSLPYVDHRALSGAAHGSVPVHPDAIDAVLGWITKLYAP